MWFDAAIASQIVNISHMRVAEGRSLRICTSAVALNRDKLQPEVD